MPTTLTDRFIDAVRWANELHGGHLRKGTETPYLAHLMAVSAIVLEHGGTEDEAIAAVLHDAVEDQGGAPVLAEIRSRFGDEVATIVEGCTDDAPARGAAKAPWKKRKQAYIDHVAKERNRSVLLVSAADKLHNARTISADFEDHGDELWERFNAGRDDILWYYAEMVAAFGQAEDRLNKARDEPDPHLGRLLNRLQETVEELHLMVEIADSEEDLADLWEEDE
jgi:(p)ppGpp synthase/HD superfamily hydrolase